jgi:hypothetical protein
MILKSVICSPRRPRNVWYVLKEGPSRDLLVPQVLKRILLVRSAETSHG